MSFLSNVTTTDIALATFAMMDALYRELVASGTLDAQAAARALHGAALIAEAKPHGEAAGRLIRSLPLAQQQE